MQEKNHSLFFTLKHTQPTRKGSSLSMVASPVPPILRGSWEPGTSAKVQKESELPAGLQSAHGWAWPWSAPPRYQACTSRLLASPRFWVLCTEKHCTGTHHRPRTQVTHFSLAPRTSRSPDTSTTPFLALCWPSRGGTSRAWAQSLFPPHRGPLPTESHPVPWCSCCWCPSSLPTCPLNFSSHLTADSASPPGFKLALQS